MMTPEPSVADEIRSFVRENWEFFARWDNGEVDPADSAWLESRNCDDWTLVNARLPGQVAHIEAFGPMFRSLHGRFADDPVTPRVDFLVVGQLATDTYLATYVQHYDFASGRTTSRLITVVLVRDGEALKAQLVHE